MKGRETPSNAAFAEALFALAERERSADRRLALFDAGYRALDAFGPARRRALDGSPPWARPLIVQLAGCRSAGALAAAVERLSAGGQPPRRATRERFLSREEVASIVSAAPDALQPARLRGAFHWHTRASDGRSSLETMARVCRRKGSCWAVVTDHSRGLEIASGLDEHGVRIQRRQIERWNRISGDELRLFHGLEVEILDDGSIDISRREREALDVVVAAVHRKLDPGTDQTQRLLRAVSTPGVHVLAHPRGRLFNVRPGIRARWEKVFSACADHGVAVEINGFPRRQDLDWELARVAYEAGCTLILASDAHAAGHLDFDAYACAIAARAHIPATAILNFARTETFEEWLAGGE